MPGYSCEGRARLHPVLAPAAVAAEPAGTVKPRSRPRIAPAEASIGGVYRPEDAVDVADENGSVEDDWRRPERTGWRRRPTRTRSLPTDMKSSQNLDRVGKGAFKKLVSISLRIVAIGQPVRRLPAGVQSERCKKRKNDRFDASHGSPRADDIEAQHRRNRAGIFHARTCSCGQRFHLGAQVQRFGFLDGRQPRASRRKLDDGRAGQRAKLRLTVRRNE